jgi:CheY-like chemotaxis protein
LDDTVALALVVDDDPDFLTTLGDVMEELGYECWREQSADAALRRLGHEARGPEVVLLDLVMPGMPAAQFLSQLKGRAPWWSARIILMTAASVKEIPGDLPYDAVLLKPFTMERLREVVQAGQLLTPPRP